MGNGVVWCDVVWNGAVWYGAGRGDWGVKDGDGGKQNERRERERNGQ